MVAELESSYILFEARKKQFLGSSRRLYKSGAVAHLQKFVSQFSPLQAALVLNDKFSDSKESFASISIMKLNGQRRQTLPQRKYSKEKEKTFLSNSFK